jgi:hypothetical protein
MASEGEVDGPALEVVGRGGTNSSPYISLLAISSPTGRGHD